MVNYELFVGTGVHGVGGGPRVRRQGLLLSRSVFVYVVSSDSARVSSVPKPHQRCQLGRVRSQPSSVAMDSDSEVDLDCLLAAVLAFEVAFCSSLPGAPYPRHPSEENFDGLPAEGRQDLLQWLLFFSPVVSPSPSAAQPSPSSTSSQEAAAHTSGCPLTASTVLDSPDYP
jgi:hypothetical protein